MDSEIHHTAVSDRACPRCGLRLREGIYDDHTWTLPPAQWAWCTSIDGAPCQTRQRAARAKVARTGKDVERG